jgi:hypothetical protein
VPTIKHPQPRFSGYRLTNQGKAELYLPGQTGLKNGQVKAEILLPGESQPVQKDTVQQGNYWVTKEPVPLGTDYRFRVNDQETLEVQVAIKGKTPFRTAALTKKGGDAQSVWEFTAPLASGSHMVFQIPFKEDVPRVRAEKIVAGQNPEVLPVRKEGANWVFSDPKAAPGTTYRLSPALDMLEVVNHDRYGSFNRVSPHELNSPQKSTVMGDLFQDSLVPTQRFKTMEATVRAQKGMPAAPNEPHVPVLPVRNHFNQFAAASGGGQQTGLDELLPDLKAAGVSSILLKPFFGGDNLSSHRYWTVDPYLLNSSFSSKTAFRNSLKEMLGKDMKLYADGAFVNQGLDGVQITSNLVHGFSSPYWRWLKYGDEATPGGPGNFPGLAHKKYTFGVLPSVTNQKTGLPTVAMDHFAVRIVNDPTAKASQYDSRKPTFVELYDPRLEAADGQPKTKDLPIIKESSDSVQKYRFPVDPQEVIEKSKMNPLNDESLKKSMMEWKRFRLDKSTGDDSAVKWDGQVNAAMLNTRNEQVVDYLKGAVGYWSRLVMNTHIGNVAEELQKTKAQHPQASVSQWVKNITKADANPKTPGILPPVTDEAQDTLTAYELQRVMDHAAPDHSFQNAGKAFAKRLLDEVPMDVLPLPTLFKADLCYPGLKEALNPTQRGGFANFMSHVVLGTLTHLPLLGRVFKAIRNFFYPLPFQKALGEKMEHIFEQLDTKTQYKLRHNNMQSLLADRVGETLYLSLLTGLTPDQVKLKQENPKALEDAFYQGMPQDLLQADPVVASKLLPRLLNQRLKKLSSHQMAKLVDAELKNLDPKLAAVAQAILQKREAGLNWRIDAARDVGDMSRVLDTPPDKRAGVFKEEINYVQKFWDKLAGAMRAPFPKTSIIAELTDFELLANHNKPVAAQAMKQLFDGNTFSGTPNMSHLYSPLMQLVNFAQRPDEYGKRQMGSGGFLNELQRMSEAVSFPALRQYQNMTTSHDYPTSSHALLINPDLFNMDLLKWWGLKDDLTVAANELKSKACFEENRNQLNKPGVDIDTQKLNSALYRLTTLLHDPKTAALLKGKDAKSLQAFYSSDAKAKHEETNCPTPQELKGKFAEQLFDALEPKDLGLETPQQMSELKAALKARMTEPSETKAMRGAIVNAVLQQSNFSEKERQALWAGLDKAAEKWGRHLGYQQLDTALNHVFETIDPAVFAGQLEAKKLALYQTASKPVMENLQRLFAVQAALPGNPSVYLNDLFAQGGSEWIKNVFVQNRNLIRTDKLQDDVDFKNFYGEVGKIFGARSNPAMLKAYPELQALNNGALIPVTPDEKSGVLPIVRDNGEHQVITLVNVGTTKALDFNNKAGFGKEANYPMPERPKADLTKYQPDLSELGLRNGTTYQDVNSQEWFKVNNGRLHPASEATAGVPVSSWRMLVRRPDPSQAKG